MFSCYIILKREENCWYSKWLRQIRIVVNQNITSLDTSKEDENKYISLQREDPEEEIFWRTVKSSGDKQLFFCPTLGFDALSRFMLTGRTPSREDIMLKEVKVEWPAVEMHIAPEGDDVDARLNAVLVVPTARNY